MGLIINLFWLKDWWKWLYLVLRTFTLNLIQTPSIKYRGRLLDLNFSHHSHVSLWIKSKEKFSKVNKLGLGFCLNALMFFFSSEQLAKENEFLNQLNSVHPKFQFTHKHSREIFESLNDTVKVHQGEFIKNWCGTLIGDHQYLHFGSCSASHTKT